jgi:serine/threonine protein phosphatase PrpC
MGSEPAQVEWQVEDQSGTTVLLALVTPSLVCLAHVGDSRAALLAENNDRALTRDHNLLSDGMCLKY